MENEELISAQTAMVILGVDEAGLVDLLIKKELLAYHLGFDISANVVTLLQNERWRALPLGPYSRGKWSEQQIARTGYLMRGGGLPTVNSQMINNVLSVLAFKKAAVEVYRHTMTPAEDVTPAAAQAFDHNEDFTSVTKDGVTFGPLTKTQAAIIKVLYEASEKTPSYLREETIRQKAAVVLDQSSDDEHGRKIKDVFKRDKAAYDALIERVRPGVYQLKV